MITDIKEMDHGSYQCRAENDVETLDAVAEVTVQGEYHSSTERNSAKKSFNSNDLCFIPLCSVPPRFIKKPEDKVANENEDLELECKIYGKPEPKVTWLKNGEKITLSAYWQLVDGSVS